MHNRVAEFVSLTYAVNMTVIFLSVTSLCVDDVLKLLYQKAFQAAIIVCVMDLINDGSVFHDA